MAAKEVKSKSSQDLFNATKTGAQRESIGTKINTDLVPYELICAAAAGLNYGKEKYSARNFEKGLSYLSLCGSIERHNRAIMDGEEIDTDSGLPHFVLLASSAAMLVHNISNEVVIDDRACPKPGDSVSVIAETFETISRAGTAYRKLDKDV